MSTLGHPRDHFPAWEEIIRYYPGYWKKLINCRVRHAALQRHIVIQFHERIFAYYLDLEASGAPLGDSEDAQPDVTVSYGCMHCGLSFASRAGEGAHLFKTHGVTAAARRLYNGTCCPCCLNHYHSHSRVLAHLRTAHRCRRQLIAQRHWCDPVPGAGSGVNVQQLAHNDGALPFMQAQGPTLPAAGQEDFMDYHLELYEDIYLALLETTTLARISIVTRIRAQPLSWTFCRKMLEQLIPWASAIDLNQ